MQTILQTDISNNIYLYYCQSSITNPTTHYTIPTAAKLYTVIVTESEKKIDQLRKINEQIDEKYEKIKGVVNIILPVVLVVVGGLVGVFGLLVFGIFKNVRSNI